ncbi:MAG: hypothetical protein JO264_07770 [Acidisphaera sp.]|nr:hypothetical protein [Acidisphaera sp.]
MTEGDAEKSWKKHIASALDLTSGQLYDWIRDVVRHNEYVGVHVLQSDIIPADLAFYERYWISQFPDLFNLSGNDTPASMPTDVARQVILTIKANLVTQADSL